MTVVEDDIDAARLAADLGEQVECYRRLARLAESQHAFVEQGATDRLLEVLQGRQAELGRITAIEERLRPIKRRWPEVSAALPAGERESAEAMFHEARSLLASITAADQGDALVLQQRKLNLGKQIAAATGARTVNRNYAAAAYAKKPGKLDVAK